eukprot:CAMPEP_0201566422 /NCGR_PEP_ID=MMETSP0190_2-20130828/6169_1 /ASSEMBLY_ACC=CAM_ASM_000263 /TAXON_ID=37353 /ORGANISM="Rosalina sp." /LENGTH=137 /DNA_ID=CAMNT_0047985093 /DNA_START=28 /DNA_END=438 /DNA_ORIENTATION=+
MASNSSGQRDDNPEKYLKTNDGNLNEIIESVIVMDNFVEVMMDEIGCDPHDESILKLSTNDHDIIQLENEKYGDLNTSCYSPSTSSKQRIIAQQLPNTMILCRICAISVFLIIGYFVNSTSILLSILNQPLQSAKLW